MGTSHNCWECPYEYTCKTRWFRKMLELNLMECLREMQLHILQWLQYKHIMGDWKMHVVCLTKCHKEMWLIGMWWLVDKHRMKDGKLHRQCLIICLRELQCHGMPWLQRMPWMVEWVMHAMFWWNAWKERAFMGSNNCRLLTEWWRTRDYETFFTNDSKGLRPNHFAIFIVLPPLWISSFGTG